MTVTIILLTVVVIALAIAVDVWRQRYPKIAVMLNRRAQITAVIGLWQWTHPPTMQQVTDEIRQEMRQQNCATYHVDCSKP
jgi:hypothetical protein